MFLFRNVQPNLLALKTQTQTTTMMYSLIQCPLNIIVNLIGSINVSDKRELIGFAPPAKYFYEND